MNSERSSEPPDEPLRTSELALLSPASPKPIHFPTPTNIPILEMQTDVDFNQTEAHINDATNHPAELRPGLWQDPNEQQGADDHASPFSTGGEAVEAAQGDTVAQRVEPLEEGETADDTVANQEPGQVTNEASHEANATLEVQSAPQTDTTDAPASSDPSVPSLEPNATSAAQLGELQPDQAHSMSAPAFNGNVDVQALLDTLQVPQSATATNGMTSASPSQAQPSAPGLESSPSSAAGLGMPPSGLPPRPPPQEQPLIHPNYVHSQHIRDYHPHAANPAFQPQGHVRTGSQGNLADISSRNFVPPVHSPSQSASAVTPQQQAFFSPSSATVAQSALQTPLSAQSAYSAASVQQPYQGVQQGYGTGTTTTPIESRRETKLAAGEVPSAEDRPWNAEIQAKYDRFIETERHYVSEGRWEQFPIGSRLFVGTRNLDGTKNRKDEISLVDDTDWTEADRLAGNLSSEKVTKRDIFHVFHGYGELAQISIKQAYGFVQFLSAEECKRALDGEQGTQIREKRIHLEISKPQKNRQQNQNQGRRSRSPDYGRGSKQGAGGNRYDGGRQGGYGRPGFRSPSPPRGYRDRYDDRYRQRSPDYGRRGSGRYRSPSPRRGEEDDLPLPKRAPRDVPDVQILVLDSLDRDFISWVEQAFSKRNVRVDVLLLSPRLNEAAVVRRQIVEGVVAVVKLTRMNQNTGKIGLQIFNRQGGAGNVAFEEYADLDPPVCAELVLRAKQAQPAPPQAYGGGYGGQYSAPPPAMPPQQQYAGYGQPAYGQPPPGPPSGFPPGGQQPQNLQNLITSLDPNGLQNLLSAMNQQSPNTPQTAGSYGTPQQAPAGYPPQYGQQQHQAQPPPQQQQQGGQVNMQDILARLGTYKQ